MDLMSIRRGLMAQMTSSRMVGVKQVVVTPTESSHVITFNVDARPYGILLTCDDDDYSNDTKVTRASGLWTNRTGAYIGKVYTISRSSSYDYYTPSGDMLVYDGTAGTLTINTANGYFVAGETYYLTYFTIPF